MIKELVRIANRLDKKGLVKEASILDKIIVKLCADEPLIHQVESGDILGAIANQYGITIKQIIESNNLLSDKLSIGQELIIPDPEPEIPEEEDDESIISNTEVVAATLMGEGGSVYGPDLMKRIYTVIKNRSNNSGISIRKVVLAPKQFSYWNDKSPEEEVKSWSSSNLPKTKAWWKEAKNIIEQDKLDSEVGESAYYINLSIASPEAAKRLMGKNWKTIFVGDHHTYGLNGPPWDSHKA